ncbi:MAG: O-antigen ligase family protein [Chloroflexota bacterium]
MRHIWLYLLPLLYLPDTLLSFRTPFGVLKTSDVVVTLYIVSLIIALRYSPNHPQLSVNSLKIPFLLFMFWAMVGTLLIPIRYPQYGSTYQLQFGLFKLGKFALYAYAGWLTMHSCIQHKRRQGFMWSLLASATTLSISMIITSRDAVAAFQIDVENLDQALIDNLVNVVLAIFICLIVGFILNEQLMGKQWRNIASFCVILMLFGMVLGRGRGGWLSAFIGVSYLFIQYRQWRVLFIIGISISLITVSYNSFPVFRSEVDKTLNPELYYSSISHQGIGGFDDGNRINIWVHHIPKIFETPFFGRGFFHRDWLAGIASAGSHNFFLQMFLETGLIGGILILLLMSRMWQSSLRISVRQQHLHIPVQASMIAAVIGGMTGEYYYGGIGLFSIIISYGVIGSIPDNENWGLYERIQSIRHRLWTQKVLSTEHM